MLLRSFDNVLKSIRNTLSAIMCKQRIFLKTSFLSNFSGFPLCYCRQSDLRSPYETITFNTGVSNIQPNSKYQYRVRKLKVRQHLCRAISPNSRFLTMYNRALVIYI